MNSKEVARRKQRLDNLFQQVSTLGGDAELQSHWACYLCVLVSGFLETSIQIIYGEYTAKQASPHVTRYVQRQLQGFQNAKMGNILDLTGKFHADWATDLKIATDDDLKDAVESVIANRHRIAHGDSVDLTYTRIYDYYKRVIKVIELIDDQCK